MVPTINTIRQRFSGEWAALRPPAAILTVCRDIGYTAWRDRVLTPVTTIHGFLLPILHGNTACSHLPPLSGGRFSAAAYWQARARLPRRCFDLLWERFGSAVPRTAGDEGRWHGHRTLMVDGAGGSMPDTPAVPKACGQPSEQRPGCGFPVARLLGLFHAGSGVLRKLGVAPLLTHDLAQVQAVHPSGPEGDVLVADRGLCSSAHVALLVQAGGHAVRRVGARQLVDCTPGRPVVRPSVRRTAAVKGLPRSCWLKTLGAQDHLVVWLTPTTCPSWRSREPGAALPESVVLREVRDDIGRPGFRTRQITLVTTLLDAASSRVADLAEWSRQRGQVETALAQLKTTMQRAGLHGTTVAGVLKERTVFALVDNLVRMVMCQSASRQHLGVERISVLDARRWRGAPSRGIPLGVLILIPIRPHRVQPRVKKRRPKRFPLMLTPRQALRQQLVEQEPRG